MRKVGLVKGKVRRAIAVASVFMLTCSVEAGGIEAGMMTSYAQQADDSGSADEFGGAEAAGAASEENEESGPEEDSVAGEESGLEKGSVEDEESGSEDGSGEGEKAGTEEGSGEDDETGTEEGSGEEDETGTEESSGEEDKTGSEEGSGEGEDSEPGEEAGEEEELGEGEETGQEESSQEEGEAGIGESTQEEAGTDESPEKEEEAAGTEEDSGKEEETGTGESDRKEDETGSVGESGGKETDPVSTPSAETSIAQANQLTAVTPQAEAEEEWVLTDVYEKDGFYYRDETYTDPITNAYIEIQEDGEFRIIRVNGDGKRDTSEKGKWIEGEVRYVDKNGYLKIDEIERVANCYGKFDDKGYWTAIENVLFEDEGLTEDLGVNLWLYSGKDGNIAGPDGYFYCFIEEADGMRCYLYNRDRKSLEEEPQSIGWLGFDDSEDSCGFYIDENGYLVEDSETKRIGDSFYSFGSLDVTSNEKGGSEIACNASLIKSELITIVIMNEENEEEVSYYVDENGEIVKKEFVDYDGETYYFDENGEKLCRNWIEDAAGDWFYVNGEGHVVKDDTRRTGGSYGTFDAEGRWTPVKGFFDEELDDGTVVRLYSDEEGDIAGPYDEAGMDGTTEEKMTFYRFVEEDGKTACYLMDGAKGTVLDERETGPAWIKDLYLGEDGYLITSQTSVKIGDTYYNFDAEGISSYAAGAIVEEDGKKYCVGEDGTFVKNQFADDEEGNTLYFGADGSQQFSQWVDDGGERFYVGADGYVVKGAENIIIGGRYGSFDESGCWTAGEAGLVTNETGTFYCMEEGKLAGPSDQETSYYGLVADESGREACYLFDAQGNPGSERQTKLWFGDYYVGEDGYKVTNASYMEIDGVYYDFDAEGNKSFAKEGMFEKDGKTYYMGEDGTVLTDQFKDVDGETLYFGEDGSQQFHQWIEYNGGFRYVDGKGYVVKNDDGKMAGGNYGSFDGEGYWKAVEDVFFTSDMDDGTVVTFYSGSEGKVAGPENQEMVFYCLVAEDERQACYLYEAGEENDAIGSVKQANLWIGDRYIGADGYVTANTVRVEIGGVYYDFDADGKGTVSPEGLMNRDGKTYYIGSEGTLVKEAFVDVEGETLYFGTDGSQQFRQWIEDGNGFRFIDNKGYMVKNENRIAGGYYGTFDSQGYWTAIENEFFKQELDSGSIVWYYSGDEGLVYKNGDGRFYAFAEDASGAMTCYLMDSEGENLTTELVAGQWIGHLWVNAQGVVGRNSTEAVDGIYYTFDGQGYGTVITYQVTYVLGDGSNSGENPSRYTGESAAVALADPSRSGYTFDGWYTDSAYTNRVTQLTSKDNSDPLTLYAKWNRIVSSGSDDSDRDIGISVDSGSSSSAGGTSSAGSSSSAAVSNQQQVTSAAAGQSVTVSAGGSSISSVVAQSAAGSVTGNTIVTAAAAPAVTVSEGHSAQVVTIAVGADGSTRSLLASDLQGSVMQQTAAAQAQGPAAVQNVVVYADGTQVSQKSGADELSGFVQEVVAAEQAIQNGTMNIAAAYSGKVSLNLPQYVQVGAAVTYAVTPGANGPASQMQMEQTSLTAGQQIVVMVTDAAGNVTVSDVVVGANGVVQYQIPGSNCIVRFLRLAG